MNSQETDSRSEAPMLSDGGHDEPPPPADAPVPGRRKSSGARSCAIATIVGVAVVIWLVFFVVVLIAIRSNREATRRASCQRNLKQWGIIFKMHANESQGEVFPPLSTTHGEFCPATDTIYPEYLADGQLLACPSDPEYVDSSDPAVIGDESYFYLGYATTNEAEARTFIDAYRQQKQIGGDFEGDLAVASGSGTGGTDRIMRLREGIERDLSISQDQIPVMFDRSFAHHVPPGGINVLYMDGHVEFQKEGEFPAQRWFLDALADLGD